MKPVLITTCIDHTCINCPEQDMPAIGVPGATVCYAHYVCKAKGCDVPRVCTKEEGGEDWDHCEYHASGHCNSGVCRFCPAHGLMLAQAIAGVSDDEAERLLEKLSDEGRLRLRAT